MRAATNPSVAIERENLAAVAYAAQCMMAEGYEAGVLANRGGQFGGDQNLAAERFAQNLDARRFVDCGPDHREIEPVDRTDIAVEHISQMKCQVDRGRPLAGRAPCSIQPIDL